jgi:Glycosyltransferase family 92
MPQPKMIVTFLVYLLFFCIVSEEIFGKEKKNKFKYDLAICAIFRDEAPYLKEWIEFHRLLGVEHFYLYNNRSSDHCMEVLAPYISKKIVTLIDWHYRFKEPNKWSPIQCSAYQDTIDKIKGTVKWLAILDIDEFLFPIKTETLIEFLKDYEQFGGVCVNWQMYGTSHVSKIPENKLLIETLHLKAPVNHGENNLVKSIVQPSKVSSCLNPHFCCFIPDFYQINENMEKFEGPVAPYVSVNKIRVNHYWSRDEDFFYRIKVPRRESWKDNLEGQIKRLNTLNSEPDDGAIQRFIPALRKKIFGKKS